MGRRPAGRGHEEIAGSSLSSSLRSNSSNGRPTIISATRSLWRYEKIGTRRRSHRSHHKALLAPQSAGSARGGLHLSRRTARRRCVGAPPDISYREHYRLFVRECNQPHAVLEPPHESAACDHRATAPTIRQGRRSDYL